MVTVQLPPPVAPFSRIKNPGESITIKTAGKVLVIPTDDAAKLPSFNRTVLNSNRLTIAESPFGGLKGSGSPDYAVGTIFTSGDGIYITDTAGNNSTKTLTAGKLKELSLLTVNTTAKTITEEFVISNTNTANGTPLIIDDCNQTTGWSVAFGGTPTFDCDGSSLHLSATASGSAVLLQKTVSLDLSAYSFLIIKMKRSAGSNGTKIFLRLTDNAAKRFIVTNNMSYVTGTTEATFIVPIKATTTNTNGALPNTLDAGFSLANITKIEIGLGGTTGQVSEFWVSDISADVAKAAYVEVQVPDNLADSSLEILCWNGTSYQTCRTCKLDSTFSDVSTTPANLKLLDGTKVDDIYGATLGRGVFPKGIAGATVTGSTGTMTFSANKGTKYRYGLMVTLPPADSRTYFSKIRMKLIITYANSGQTIYEFNDSTNASYGLQNMTKPWIALYDPTGSEIDFYLFTHRPKNLIRKRDDSGNIYELTLYPGNGAIYHGKIKHANLTTDSNSDTIPDCLEYAVEGSISKFLLGYQFVPDPEAITIVTSGSTFAPVLQTTGTPEIIWLFSDGSTSTSATPSKNFGSSASRTHTLRVTPWTGLLTINVGYAGEDGGEAPGEGSNLTAVTQQNVTSITNLKLATNLTKIACCRNPITSLDLSSLASLTTVEAYSASSLATVTLLNNTALKRLCIESCNVRNLDLSNVPNIEDLRLSLQSNGHIGITWAATSYTKLWHLCARDVLHDNAVPSQLMPKLQDLYLWSTGIAGALTLVSPDLKILRIYSTSLTSITFPEIYPVDLVTILLNNNLFNESMIDSILHYCDTGAKTWRTLTINGNVAPSADGLAHKTHLVTTLHWTVTTD